jgi:hypothetical protein
LQVSVQRRAEPAISILLATPSSSRSWRISSAIGRTLDRRNRSPRPSSVTPSSEERMFSSVFGPSPRIELILPCSAASFSSVRFSTPISS